MATDPMLELAKSIVDQLVDLDLDILEVLISNPSHALGPLVAKAGSLSEAERERLAMWIHYDLRQRLHDKAQPRALKLLRSFLTPKQRRQLRSSIVFDVVGSAGGLYRLAPLGSYIARLVERNGRRYAVLRYCFHDPETVLPPADVMIGTMLHLMTDEAGFLAEANASVVERRRRMAEEEGLRA